MYSYATVSYIIFKYFACIRFGMVLVQINRQKWNILGDEILQCIHNDLLVVTFNDVIRIAHCTLNIVSTQPVAILTFEWIL